MQDSVGHSGEGSPSTPPLTVTRLGAEGDGIAVRGDQAVYLPFTLPGERIGPDGEIIAPSPHRVAPPCRHFGTCGGCAAQHMDDTTYAGWKTDLLADALRRLGYEHPLPPIARTPPLARRRMDLAIRRSGAAIRIGLHARRSTEIVDMQDCPVLHPRLFALVAALRPVLRSLTGLKREGSAVVNLTEDGPDLLLRTDVPLTAPDRTRLAALAQAQDLPRIAWALGDRSGPEPACALRPATIAFDGHRTPLPPGAFLQASPEGESAIRTAVIAALPRLRGKARIVELFAGCGTLSHSLARHARVDAFEADPAAVAALRAARNPRITVTARDLARQPLQPADLATAACIVLDPPHAGAREQMPALATSGKPVIYVTCNPAALLRDARTLLAAGYRVTAATAIDQFLWSARVEGVVAFARDAR